MSFRKILLFIFILSGFYTNACYASAYELRGKHLEAALDCETCHATSTPVRRAPASSCTKCHEDYPALGELTANAEPNPHASHQGEIRCTACHKVHEPSVLYCDTCHAFELKME